MYFLPNHRIWFELLFKKEKKKRKNSDRIVLLNDMFSLGRLRHAALWFKGVMHSCAYSLRSMLTLEWIQQIRKMTTFCINYDNQSVMVCWSSVTHHHKSNNRREMRQYHWINNDTAKKKCMCHIFHTRAYWIIRGTIKKWATMKLMVHCMAH